VARTRSRLSRSAGAVRTLVAATIALAACASGSGSDPAPVAAPAELDPALGGAATRAIEGRNAFGFPLSGLSDEQVLDFEVGDSFFTKNWVTAPASTESRDGLGPTFNAQACSSCHVLDGRGAPPTGPDDATTRGLLLRLSVPADAAGPPTADDPEAGVPGETAGGTPAPEPVYGGQLQDRAIDGVDPEGRMQITWEAVDGTYDDGSPFEIRRPVVEIVDLAYGPLDDAVQVSPRLAPQVIGVGLLEAVPEDTIVALADEDDRDGDGISGRPNLVPDPRTGETVVGRFGWKANVGTVEAQVAGAFHGDVGITSSLAPEQNCGPAQPACDAAVGDGEPEIDDERLARVAFYNRTLAVPAMRDHEAGDVRAGAVHFDDLGCSGCHVAELRTGAADVPDLADQTIHPYTDLLLHDMGPGLADGRPDLAASGSEWRTPPLWGIGLLDDVGGERFLLHDGRARTLAEAILWHGGEAQAARDAYAGLDADRRDELLAFLESL
jgi:CxxC motif-containing protein (DUF1111 family)